GTATVVNPILRGVDAAERAFGPRTFPLCLLAAATAFGTKLAAFGTRVVVLDPIEVGVGRAPRLELTAMARGTDLAFHQLTGVAIQRVCHALEHGAATALARAIGPGV